MLKTRIKTRTLVAILTVLVAGGSISAGLYYYGSRILTHEPSASNFSLGSNEFSDGGTVLVFAHQDDDLVWMQPFWQYAGKFVLAAFPTDQYHEEVVNQISYNSYKSKWEHPWGDVDDFEAYISKWIDPGTERGKITVVNIKDKIRPFIADQNVKRIVTHNNWGEYGHLHHRLVNQAVRELAIEYGKDVWCMSVKIPTIDGAPDENQYISTGTFGMQFKSMSMNHDIINNVREIYQQEENKLISMNQWKWTNIWSWGDGEYQYPNYSRIFIKIVDKGNDLSQNNTSIQNLMKEIPVYGSSGSQPSSSTGTVIQQATLDGKTWTGNLTYQCSASGILGSVQTSNLPLTAINRPPGTRVCSYVSGGPPNATFLNITPSKTQTLTAGGAITFTYNFTSSTATTGTVIQQATLDGKTWTGNLTYQCSASGILGSVQTSNLPLTAINRPPGTRVCSYVSGGPPNATFLNITPSKTQTLTAGGAITFTYNFTSSTIQW